MNNEDSDMDIEAQEILESFVPEVNINDECSVCPYDNCLWQIFSSSSVFAQTHDKISP